MNYSKVHHHYVIRIFDGTFFVCSWTTRKLQLLWGSPGPSQTSQSRNSNTSWNTTTTRCERSWGSFWRGRFSHQSSTSRWKRNGSWPTNASKPSARVVSSLSETFTPTRTGYLRPTSWPLQLIQVWSLTQFYSVDFSKSRIGVKKCVFNKCTIKVYVSIIICLS